MCLYLHQHGATALELAALANCTERTVHRDLGVIKGVVPINVVAGVYHIPVLPEIQKLDFTAIPTPKPTRNKTVNRTSKVIFRKWYGVASRNERTGGMGDWFVVRADKEESKGTYIGPVQLSGKSYHIAAVEAARERNTVILKKREETVEKLRKMGWTEKAIQQIKADALAEAKEEMGDDYIERDP
jgi:hypothetical protein